MMLASLGLVQFSVTVVSPGVAARPVGVAGGTAGVAVAVAAAPLPAVLVARTSKV